MQSVQHRVPSGPAAWSGVVDRPDPAAQLVLAFGPAPGATQGAPDAAWHAELARRWPGAARVYCSTGGQIAGAEVFDAEVLVTAVEFAHTQVRAAAEPVRAGASGRDVGAALARALAAPGLCHVLLFVDGLRLNGSDVVGGLLDALPADVRITGGLAGDDDRFGAVQVRLDDAPDADGAVAVGLYGERLTVGTGAAGGWELFGPDRLVTRVQGNVLYELDGEPALALYKRYLGPLAAELPKSGLSFPLALRGGDGGVGVVRTVLGVDEATNSVVLAGDVPHGAYVRLMMASPDGLIDGAGSSVALAVPTAGEAPDLTIAISCVGRRWLLGQRAEEELEAVADALGGGAGPVAGFYSYGEVGPLGADTTGCVLHNQTMTVTTLWER